MFKRVWPPKPASLQSIETSLGELFEELMKQKQVELDVPNPHPIDEPIVVVNKPKQITSAQMAVRRARKATKAALLASGVANNETNVVKKAKKAALLASGVVANKEADVVKKAKKAAKRASDSDDSVTETPPKRQMTTSYASEAFQSFRQEGIFPKRQVKPPVRLEGGGDPRCIKERSTDCQCRDCRCTKDISSVQCQCSKCAETDDQRSETSSNGFGSVFDVIREFTPVKEDEPEGDFYKE